MSGAGAEFVFRDGDPHRGGASAEQLGGVHIGSGGDEPEDDVRGELCSKLLSLSELRSRSRTASSARVAGVRGCRWEP